MRTRFLPLSGGHGAVDGEGRLPRPALLGYERDYAHIITTVSCYAISLLPWRTIGMVPDGKGKRAREDNTIRVSRCKVIN